MVKRLTQEGEDKCQQMWSDAYRWGGLPFRECGVRWRTSLHQLCVAFCCLAVYLPSAFARCSFNSDRQPISSRLSPGESYWCSLQNSRKSYTNQGNSWDLWGLRPARVSLSSLFLSEACPHSTSFLGAGAEEWSTWSPYSWHQGGQRLFSSKMCLKNPWGKPLAQLGLGTHP